MYSEAYQNKKKGTERGLEGEGEGRRGGTEGGRDALKRGGEMEHLGPKPFKALIIHLDTIEREVEAMSESGSTSACSPSRLQPLIRERVFFGGGRAYISQDDLTSWIVLGWHQLSPLRAELSGSSWFGKPWYQIYIFKKKQRKKIISVV